MNESRTLYFSEVIQFFCRRAIRFCLVGVGAFALILSALLWWVEPTFRAEATFKQVLSREGEGSGFQRLLQSLSDQPQESSAISVMRSKQLLQKAICASGLQAERSGFCQIDYRGEEPLAFVVEPVDESVFHVVGHGRGRLNAPFRMEGATWTLCAMPTIKTAVVLTPLRTLLQRVAKEFKARLSRKDPHLLLLTFKHRDRQLAISFLDTLMECYQRYLSQEHEEVALAQIAYLQTRRDQLEGELEKTLDAHVAYLQSSAEEEGFLGLSQEVEMLSRPEADYRARQHALDLELKKWKKAPSLEVCVCHPWEEGNRRRGDLALKQSLIDGDPALLEEFSGIDLAVAERLFASYAEERERLTATLGKIDRVLDRIDGPNFQISALDQMLTDPVSQRIIEQAGALTLQLADWQNYSAKERSAMQETLLLQKTSLKAHLQRELQPLRDELDLVGEKLCGLRATALHLIAKEKESIEQKLEEIATQMQTLPEKWRRESHLNMRKALTLQIMEGVSQLSEEKVVQHQLFHIRSKPLDGADAPLEPETLSPFLLASTGGICTGFLFFVGSLIRAAGRGLPISRIYLRDRGFRVVEEPSRLEKLSLYIRPGDVVALIGVSFAQELAAVLSSKGCLVHVEEMPERTFGWEKPQSCALLTCKGGLSSSDAVRSIFLADFFVIGVGDERPDSLAPFPKAHCCFLF